MQFSCKITSAIITYLESEKVDLSVYFSDGEIPWEKLKDSSFWMSAPDMEAILERIQVSHDVLVKAGHETPKSKSWGVLDSVLRMMPEPKEIFQQPEKFLSYFISPEPPLENIQRSESEVSFDIPLPAEQYPLVTTYLKAAFEALPKYVGLEVGICEWNFLNFKLRWPIEQKSILTESEPHQLSKLMLQEIVAQLQNSSKELEEKNRELEKRNDELSKIVGRIEESRRSGMSASATDVTDEMINSEIRSQSDKFSLNAEFAKKPSHIVAQNLSKLHDYMVRAHQLVTLLTVNQKQSPGVKKMFQRVNWDTVQQQYPQIILESMAELKKIKDVEQK